MHAEFRLESASLSLCLSGVVHARHEGIETAFRNPDSFFHRYSQLSEDAARAIAEGLWANINLKNLRENIVPTRARADLILRKGANHLVEEVALRKL